MPAAQDAREDELCQTDGAVERGVRSPFSLACGSGRRLRAGFPPPPFTDRVTSARALLRASARSARRVPTAAPSAKKVAADTAVAATTPRRPRGRSILADASCFADAGLVVAASLVVVAAGIRPVARPREGS